MEPKWFLLESEVFGPPRLTLRNAVHPPLIRTPRLFDFNLGMTLAVLWAPFTFGRKCCVSEPLNDRLAMASFDFS